MEKIKTIISENPSLEEILYCRGYLITDKDININEGSFPFYNNWD